MQLFRNTESDLKANAMHHTRKNKDCRFLMFYFRAIHTMKVCENSIEAYDAMKCLKHECLYCAIEIVYTSSSWKLTQVRAVVLTARIAIKSGFIDVCNVHKFPNISQLFRFYFVKQYPCSRRRNLSDYCSIHVYDDFPFAQAHRHIHTPAQSNELFFILSHSFW